MKSAQLAAAADLAVGTKNKFLADSTDESIQGAHAGVVCRALEVRDCALRDAGL
jgi:hypothetical protein